MQNNFATDGAADCTDFQAVYRIQKKNSNRRTLNEDERSVLRNRRDKRLAKWPMAIAANGKRKRGQNIKQKNKRT